MIKKNLEQYNIATRYPKDCMKNDIDIISINKEKEDCWDRLAIEVFKYLKQNNDKNIIYQFEFKEVEIEETIYDIVEIVWHGRIKINELINEE